jgi:hypothetical protein
MSNNVNRFEINFTFSAIFSITRENFFKSLKVKHTQGSMYLYMGRSQWLEYKNRGDFNRFQLLTPLYGRSHISVQYLDTIILERDVDVSHIAHFFPKTTLASDAGDEFKFYSVCLENRSLVTFFTGDGHFSTSGGLQLPSGLFFQHNAQRSNIENYVGQKNGSCGSLIPDHSYIFMEPATEGKTPFTIVQSFLFPLANFRRQFADRRVTVILNDRPSTFVWYLRLIDNVDVLNVSNCYCWTNVEFHSEKSAEIDNFWSFLPDVPQVNIIGVLVDNKDVGINQANDMASVLWPGGQAVRIDMSASISEVIESIRRAKGIICQRTEYLGHMICLRSGCVVGLLNGQDADWISALAKVCGVLPKRFMRDREGKTIAVDWIK